MPTLREYFVSESNQYFGQIGEQLKRFDAGSGDPHELLRLARALRGSAHLARETRVYRAGMSLEAVARALGAGQLQWSPDVSARARRTLEELQALAAGKPDDDGDARVKSVLDTWSEVGVALPSEFAGQPSEGERGVASRQFREFAAHEVAGIAAEVESSLAQLAQDPRNTELLKPILRRQRALLGAARLDEINVVAETLRAIDDLARLIVKLNVAVKDEWAGVFRAARDVLTGALEPLRQGTNPAPTPALSQLRTLRTELIERYGDADAAARPTAPAAAAPAAPPRPTTPAQPAATAPPLAPAAAAVATTQPAPAPTSAEVVPIEQLCYGGEGALRRALELRQQLEELAGNNSDAREVVEEVFDLIRLGIG